MTLPREIINQPSRNSLSSFFSLLLSPQPQPQLPREELRNNRTLKSYNLFPGGLLRLIITASFKVQDAFSLNFQGNNGKMYTLSRLEKKDTILELKKRLHSEHGWPEPQKIVLKYLAKNLYDKKTLDYYGIDQEKARTEKNLTIQSSFKVIGGHNFKTN